MLWDIIFEFFVKYIFGGALAVNGVYTTYGGTLGWLGSPTGGEPQNTGQMYITQYYNSIYDNPYNVPIGNYLSLIATIISMVVIVILCCLLIKKIYNMCAHIIG